MFLIDNNYKYINKQILLLDRLLYLKRIHFYQVGCAQKQKVLVLSVFNKANWPSAINDYQYAQERL